MFVIKRRETEHIVQPHQETGQICFTIMIVIVQCESGSCESCQESYIEVVPFEAQSLKMNGWHAQKV